MTGFWCYIAATGIFVGMVVALVALCAAAAWGVTQIEVDRKRGYFGLVPMGVLVSWLVGHMIADIARQLCG